MSTAAFPREVLLFADTTNQNVIDVPFHGVPENLFKVELVNEKFCSRPHEPLNLNKSLPVSESKNIRASDLNDSTMKDVKHYGVSSFGSQLNSEAEYAWVVSSRGHCGVRSRIGWTSGALVASSNAPSRCTIGEWGNLKLVGYPYSFQLCIGLQDGMTHGKYQNRRLLPVNGFSSYGHGSAHSSSDLVPSVLQTSVQVAALPANDHKASPSLNRLHHKYSFPMQSKS